MTLGEALKHPSLNKKKTKAGSMDGSEDNDKVGKKKGVKKQK
jgi:hypothetical protein